MNETTARADELTEQAKAKLAELLDAFERAPNERIARMMWLDGYKAGMDATKALAEAAITKALT